jgi:phage terminase large subunit-like protein
MLDRVKVGPGVRKAVERHLRDLAEPDSPYIFNPPTGKKNSRGEDLLPPMERICKFAELMVHTKGKWAGQLIHLEDWQVFALGVAFGWLRRSDGLRRFRELYWEIPRKNGKSLIGAIIGLYLAFEDLENGAEVLCGATSMKQAYMVFRPAWMMVHKNLAYKNFRGLALSGTETNPGTIYQKSTGSKFEPIIGNPGDGASPHGAIIDEYHEHRTSDLYNAMKTGMGARTQPMRPIITTAGTDTSGPCFSKHEEAQKVLDGTVEDNELFPIIFGIDPGDDTTKGDDWTDPDIARKANPNYGVSVFADYLDSQVRAAKQSADQQASVLTKNFNVWLSAGRSWMNMLKWNACANPKMRIEDFKGQDCWLAVDLASKINIAALAIVFKTKTGHALFARHYLPSGTIELDENAHLRRWRDEGWVIETDGPRTDLRRIEEDIKQLSKTYAVQELAFDQRESNYLISSIQDWCSFDCVEVPQSPAHFNEPMKEMEAQIYSEQLQHQGDPCLNWQMGNVVKKQSHTGGTVKYYYPTKTTDKNNIDAVVAGIMALARAMTAKDTFIKFRGVRSVG